jgi:cytochrome c peroxidase
VLLLLAAGSVCAAEPAADFTHGERARILAHGPWPLPAARDPSNRASGNPLAAGLGRALFLDEGLSRFGALSCASCHKADKGWGDGRARASAAAALDRNTLSLFNVRHNRWFGWDGAADSLWMQSLRPILDPREMAASPEHVKERIVGTAGHRAAYRRVFGIDPARQLAEHVLVGAAKALAAYQETLITGRTPFDAFRDALANGDATAAGRYPAAAQRGLKIFVGSGNCSACHAGPLFTNGEFHDTGLGYFAGPGRVDSGRHGGLERLKASRFNLLGAFSDDRSRRSAWKTRQVVSQHRNFGEFRVPSLRNVALTGPYMHDGSKATLADVVRHYSELDEDRLHVHGERVLRRLDLTPQQIADLVAFLETLTEARER